MGDQHAGQTPGIDPQALERGGDPPGRDARVNEKMGRAVGDQRTVAAGAAGQCRQCQQRNRSYFL